MLQKGIQVEVAVLHRGQKHRPIGRETGVAQNTIERSSVESTTANTRKRRPTKIDDYKDYLEERLETAGKIWLPATALFREVPDRGYKIRPTPPDEPIVRF